jgi:hypothetical protein
MVPRPMATTMTATIMLSLLLMAMMLGNLLLEHSSALATMLAPMVLMMTRWLLPAKHGMRRRLLTLCVTTSCFAFQIELGCVIL